MSAVRNRHKTYVVCLLDLYGVSSSTYMYMYMYGIGVPEWALGWLPLGLGLVVEDEPSELSRSTRNRLHCTTHVVHPQSSARGLVL